MKFPFKKAEFMTSAAKVSQCPGLCDGAGVPYPEIAFVGRSNVGKSSLINHLLQNKRLAKVSSTPGKTQLMNFFLIDEGLCLVDLPGYGYAKVPKGMQRDWGKQVGEYLNERSCVRLLLFLLDIRRVPNEQDLQFMEWAAYHQKPVVLVLTKCDKVKRGERARNTQKILQTLGEENLHTVHYSATKNEGRQLLIETINRALEAV